VRDLYRKDKNKSNPHEGARSSACGEGILKAREEAMKEQTVVDPVCQMQVNPSEAAGTSVYQGKTYYFCAVGCKQAFDKHPEQYVNAR
jgi:YHS domain-containing protein